MTKLQPALRTSSLTKVYPGTQPVTALDRVEVAVPRGEFAVIMGPSGSGKSTLMHCAAGLDRPTDGHCWIGDTELSELTDDRLTDLRRDRIGFIFQSFNLLPDLTARENITLPIELAGERVDQHALRRVVDAVRLTDRLDHRPAQLSGGQQQRVACARALLGRPEVVFADEPTGALDRETSAELLGFLRRTVDDVGQTIVMVTHDPVVAGYADRVLFLVDGRLVDELPDPDPERVLDRMKTLDEVAA
ncbi:ABC transporter ATP-binding protein [Microlunatus soli]|uniref:Putative ABC transport system ATP-binding protein n=1 Tax=Microlunatus soli TaxID=630515 RepID=A0A1H1NP81_9ACTN|nr:ABC transporter ATP-binding protein [Microlunatus soli]SDS00757.1 putative ABC transport system ATP-binding protein [Microlunatus soli]